MKEYLEVLAPLCRGEGVAFQGEQYKVAAQLQVPGATRVPILVAALGSVMLKLTGRLADGTITWMTGPRTLETHIIPTLREAAKQAGRPEPRVVAGFPILLTNKPAEAREKIGKALVIYGQLPSYRAMLDREGAAGPGDVAIAGDEATLRREIARLREIGVTDFDAAITPVEDGAYARTLAFLTSELSGAWDREDRWSRTTRVTCSQSRVPGSFGNVLDACRAAVTASYPQAGTSERQGSWTDGTARQCTVVPGVEHISVLFSGATATATVRWLDGALGAYPPGRPITAAIPMIPALWLHAACAVFFLLLAETLFPRPRTRAMVTAPLPGLALAIMIAGSAAIAAVAMRFMPGGWIPLLTADYLCGFFAVAGLVIGAGVVRLGRPIVGPLPSLGVAWRTVALATAAIGPFALVAQVSWVNVQLVGARRWLVVAIYPIWLLYFLASDAMLRTRPAREYLAWSAGSAVLTIAVVVAALQVAGDVVPRAARAGPLAECCCGLACTDTGCGRARRVRGRRRASRRRSSRG